jgi:Fe-Mn family superoxide dismutase
MSKETLEYHYGKHHQAYVTKLNELISGTEFENLDLETIITRTRDVVAHKTIFNNAAQTWNHTFFWNSLSPHGGGGPKEGQSKELIERDFGGIEGFQAQFQEAACTQFGSGWCWLVLNENGKLEVMKTGNADLPDLERKIPILTCDVWEHAYYLDFQNRRPNYVETFLTHLINWTFAEERLLSI